MGGTQSTPANELSVVVKRAEERGGKIGVSGRYHRLPKRIEDDYDLKKGLVLGTGYNGSVFKATDKRSQEQFAIKAFHLNGIPKDKMLELKTEAEIFLCMDHPHVARLVGVYECDKVLNLVMECMEGGELFTRVVNVKRFPEKDAAHAVWQMLLAINYIHSRSVVHRDLKLENFLYEKKDSDHLKLIDFGFSHVWEPNTTMALSCGTLAYVAPEVLARKYTSQCDLWSLGIITFILLLGYMPFSGSEEAQCSCIKAGKWLKKADKWKRLSEQAQSFIQSLLVVDPNVRLTAEQALQHTFIKDHDNEDGGKRRPSATEDVDHSIVDALTDFAKASQFRKACMSMMAWSLTNEERKEVRDAFIALDANKKGTITLGELKQVLTERFQVCDTKIRPIFEALDTTNTEEIHYTEFLAAMVSTKISMHDDMLEKTFRRFDVDNSGFITKANLKVVLGESFDGAEVNQLIEEADLSGDGQISYEEFLIYLKKEHNDDRHANVAEKLIDTETKRHAGEEEVPVSLSRLPHEMPVQNTGSQQSQQAKPATATKTLTTDGGAMEATSSVVANQGSNREPGQQQQPKNKSRTCTLL